jgi:hypothetical protein
MELNQKKELFLNIFVSGLDKDKCYILSDITEDEQKILENDKDFLLDMKRVECLEEQKLLEMHTKAIQIATDKGLTSGVEWRLSKINPRRWGNKEIEDNEKPLLIKFCEVTKEDLEKNKNIEISK